MPDCGDGHFSKPEFVGREALSAIKDAPSRQLVTSALDDPEDSTADFGEAVHLSSVFTGPDGTQVVGLVFYPQDMAIARKPRWRLLYWKLARIPILAAS